MGISVKSRSRYQGTETESISLPNRNFSKAQAACDAFGCRPYFAIVADTADVIRVFIMTMDHLRKICPPHPEQTHWRMSQAALAKYRDDPDIKCIEFRSETKCWW
jgi:hypothetical protein